MSFPFISFHGISQREKGLSGERAKKAKSRGTDAGEGSAERDREGAEPSERRQSLL